jgi:tricorn protease
MEADKPAAEKPKVPPEVDECSPDAQKSGSESAKETAGKDSDKQSGEKKGDSAKESKQTPVVRIDFDNIDQRILALPFPARNYGGMIAGKTHVLYLLEGLTIDDGDADPRQIVHKFDLCCASSKPRTLAE